MENKTQMQKLYAIARATRTTDEYVSYIEYVLQGHPFSDRDLANKLYKAAMTKYDAGIRKHAGAIEGDRYFGAEMHHSLELFARKYRVMDDYISYLEGFVLSGKPFDVVSALSLMTEAAITMYDMRLRRKIDSYTGITIIGGYRDAV